MKKPEILRYSALFFILCLLFTGCKATDDSKTAKGSGAENAASDNMGSVATDSSEPGALITSDDSSSTGNTLYLKERQSIRFDAPETGYLAVNYFFDIADDKIHLFRVESPVRDNKAAADGQRICVQTFNSRTQNIEQYILAPEISGHEEYAIYSVGLTADGDVSLKLSDLNEEGNSFFLARMDLQGNLLETADFFPDEAAYPWNSDSYSGKKIYHLTDGRTILGSWNNTAEVSTLSWFDDENGNIGQEIGRLEGGLPSAICCDADGLLYCILGNDLLRWNPEKDTKDVLFQQNKNGVAIGGDSGLFLSGEELLLCKMNHEEIRLYVLTDQEIASPEGEIRVACVEDIGIDYIRRMASTFSVEPGAIPVKMEKKTGDAADYRNQIFAELATGKGPDILILGQEDIKLLTDRGFLLDMSDMIPEAVKSQMIPSVLEMCTIDGKMTAFTPNVQFSSMITTDQIWEKDSWTLAEFMEVAESRKDWVSLITDRSSDLSPLSLFFQLFFRDMEHLSLIDLEQGVSHLDSQEFIRLLELCQKYDRRDLKLEGDEETALLNEGEVAGQGIVIDNMIGFSQLMSRYGTDCHVVGYPAESGRGTYISPYSYIYMAVNANTEHKEEIRRFINYLLDYDQQYAIGTSGISVRMDVIRDAVSRDSGGIYRVRISSDWNDSSGAILAAKPDGTSWLEEFLDFVENSKPMPEMPEAIRTIMFEELQLYFAGDRSAEETAAVVHSRVQLYLDEQK